MSWNTNPQAEWFNYFKKKYGIAALSSAALFSYMLFGIPEFRDAFDAPIHSSYTPRGLSHEIAIHTTADSSGFTDNQQVIIKDVLDKLPVSHLSGVQFIGTTGRIKQTVESGQTSTTSAEANESGAIVMFMNSINGNFSFETDLLHEIGHQVEFHALSDAYRSEWKAIDRGPRQGHSAPTPPKIDDVVQSYAQTNELEDFAVTYAAWTTGSYQLESQAVSAVLFGGNTGLLERVLFMAGLFTNADGSVNFYDLSVSADASSTQPIDLSFIDPTLSVERVPHYRTADAITLGYYTFKLHGHVITSIENRAGEVLASGLSLSVPHILVDRWGKTDPAPYQESQYTQILISSVVSCDDNQNCDSGGGSSVSGSIKAPLMGPQPTEIVSPFPPTEYVPLQDKGVYQALAGEQAMSNPNHQVTINDQIRPHAH